MPNRFEGKGNVGSAPTLKTVAVRGEDRQVAEIRVFFDEYSRGEDGEFEQTGGIWLAVSVWGRRAEQVARLLRKGARVMVQGELRTFEYTPDGTDVKVPGFQVVADDVLLTLARVESVVFAAKREEAAA
jgi:single-strand DNA-binding protein